MFQDHQARLALADYLAALQTELERAGGQSGPRELPFGVDCATLEVDIFFTLPRNGQARSGSDAQFWVAGTADGDSGGSGAARTTQKLIVRLSPRPKEEATAPGNEAALSALPRSRQSG
ncbi:hypothetical protein E4L96_10495 [Massilia arenosa]|uniref:Trypsin-co-occurring domain-containing protein n=1 Tax=Zemynaea arenosa TaxID=2561931 RepID=A0A4Y9SCN8_9BURK|nr:trypco2 family protein [Massilia arenosa]TFW20391.1 hypothetical protein E4L96_10495 [Massilia arenosa]